MTKNLSSTFVKVPSITSFLAGHLNKCIANFGQGFTHLDIMLFLLKIFFDSHFSEVKINARSDKLTILQVKF